MGRETHLRAGDRVDAPVSNDEEPSPAVVYAITDTPCSEVLIDGTPLHEYGANAGSCEPDEPVVEVLFRNWLDQHVGERWEVFADDSDEADFGERLRAFCEPWNIPVDDATYSYPASRLVPRNGE